MGGWLGGLNLLGRAFKVRSPLMNAVSSQRLVLDLVTCNHF